MGLYKRKDSQFYWMTFKINGKKVNESTKTKNKKLAEKIHAKRLTEIEEGRWFPNEAKRRTFEELKDRYMKEHSSVHKSQSSCDRDVCSFKRLSEFFEGMVLADITPSRISEYKSMRQCKGVKVATVSKELELLRNALNLAVREWEWLERNPFERVRIEKPNNRIERWISPEEEKRLLDASPVWLREIIVFALNTGMRQGEILSLKWPHVDLSRCTITLLKTKNKEKRTIPINQTVLELLRAKGRVRHISGDVFTSQAGTMILARNLLRAFYLARKKAGLEDVRFHDLRHTFATRLVQAGINIYVVKELLGHKTLAMTMRYAHHYPESLRHGVEVLDRAGYVLVTAEGKESKKGSEEAPNPLIFMVGDTGFEPVTSAV
jgi:integrase